MAVDKLEYKNHQNEDPLTEISESTLTNSNVANGGSLSYSKKTIDQPFEFRKSFNALELFDLKTLDLPRLLNPFLQKSGLASLVGTSDTGKSTFLRQLGLSIVLKRKDFLGFTLNSEHHKVIYVTTEDDYNSVSFSLRKQIKELQKDNDGIELDNLKNLEFIFDSENLLETLTEKIEENPVDLIIIDAFADVFSKEINANTQVRTFLNSYSTLASKNNCLILFLHHIGKRTQTKSPSKDSIIGSQAFEAKMRVVLELRPNLHKPNLIDLWILKANFLESKYKQSSYVLELNENMYFKNSGMTNTRASDSKINNPAIIERVLSLHREGLSLRKIESALKNTEHVVGKSTVDTIIKNNTDQLKGS
ncbi:AAA family ATPase [Gelidibacter maritimus]|uniref:AAA family ATPase n=1 Tax=Gelidibacter maritimus TaxID=2761487 RepID=A0A7W2M7K4_9FLAO|nr:AAA family ATPase [Gelidibacter maritimus]MBA6153951.1 AAA family ATPase [Gelidibacter maritimus]